MSGSLVETVAGLCGLFGLIGFAGLAAIRNPCEKGRSGGLIRLLGLLGFGGLAGFWIPGVGAMGAAGAFSLWNHQSPRLRRWGSASWLFLIGVGWLIVHYLR